MNSTKLTSIILFATLLGVSCDKSEFKGNSSKEYEAVPQPTPTNPPVPPGTNLQCKPGHRLYRQICIKPLGAAAHDCGSQACKDFVGPTPDVCANVLEADGSSKWQVTREGFAYCTVEQLPACPENWKTSNNRSCTLDDLNQAANTISKAPTIDAADCPTRHKLYDEECRVHGSIGNIHMVFGPVAEVCKNYCNAHGCQASPIANGRKATLCVEAELRPCPQDWKTLGIQNCSLE